MSPNTVFEVLANPERLRIVNLLIHSDHVVIRDVMEALSMSGGMVWRHIHMLKTYDMVSFTKGGYNNLETRYYMKKEYRKEYTRILEPYLNYSVFQQDLQNFHRVAA